MPDAIRNEAEPHAAEPARILIVDDSIVARSVIARIIENNPRYAIAAAVSDVASARSVLARERVDVILLDIQMPGVDGLTALPDILAAGRGARVLVISSSCEDGAVATVQALALGAADTLVKPGPGKALAEFTGALEEKLSRLAHSPAHDLPRPSAQIACDFDVVAIGASTGGIHALTQLLRAVPSNFTAPILITQHLPDSFMPYFAAQIAIVAGRPCDVAVDGMPIRACRVLIAPGEKHMTVARGASGPVVRLTEGPSATGCLPSVDNMFTSIANVYGSRALGVVLSGMGRDGAGGAMQMHDAGAAIVVQDAETSVVWGMPGTVAQAGIADAVLPPDRIGMLIANGRKPV